MTTAPPLSSDGGGVVFSAPSTLVAERCSALSARRSRCENRLRPSPANGDQRDSSQSPPPAIVMGGARASTLASLAEQVLAVRRVLWYHKTYTCYPQNHKWFFVYGCGVNSQAAAPFQPPKPPTQFGEGGRVGGDVGRLTPTAAVGDTLLYTGITLHCVLVPLAGFGMCGTLNIPTVPTAHSGYIFRQCSMSASWTAR